MRVALLKARLTAQGGLEKYTHRIAAAFFQKGAEVTLLTTQLPDSQASYQYHSMPLYPIPGFLQIEQFDRHVSAWLKKNPVDVIFGMDRNRRQTHLRAGNGIHAAYLKRRIAIEGRFKYWTCHLNPLHRKILELEKTAFLYPELRKVFVNSYMVERELLEHYPIDAKKIVVIHNGVEWKEREKDFLALEKTDRNRLEFLFIGNGYRRKGLDVLLKALSIWKWRDFHLSIIGKDKRLSYYSNLSKKLGLAQHVHFYGPQKNVIPFYQNADVLVIPSFYDPFANVTVEALAMGLFVISSKQNGGHEIITEQNGTLIEDLLDPEAILSALDRALSFRKTKETGIRIRASIETLDFSNQLSQLIDHCG